MEQIDQMEPQDSLVAAGAESPALVPIELVRPSPFRVRLVLDVTTLRRLDAEAKRVTSVEPVVVWQTSTSPRHYVVLEGEWRRRVALRAGHTHLPVRIRPVRDERDAEIRTLIAELRQWGHTAVAEGEAYARLFDLGLTQTQIARAVHKEKSTICKRLRLVRLPEYVRTFIDAGILTGKQGQELHQYLPNPSLFNTMLTRAKAGWSSRKLATARSQATA